MCVEFYDIRLKSKYDEKNAHKNTERTENAFQSIYVRLTIRICE